jgi:DNA-directed RNA polymerase specialized sigma24 family protein
MIRVSIDRSTPMMRRARLHGLAAFLLDEALTEVEATDKRKAELVRLRYFAGLTVDQAAHALGISASTADNDWVYAKSWLRVAMALDEADGPED